MKCPFQHEATFERQANGDYRPAVTTPRKTSKEHDLWEALLDYWRWVAEGKLPHSSQHRSDPKAPYQLFHDPYHESIRYHAIDKTYGFDIQIDDGPDGDTWWAGTFRIEPGNRIAIIEERWHS